MTDTELLDKVSEFLATSIVAEFKCNHLPGYEGAWRVTFRNEFSTEHFSRVVSGGGSTFRGALQNAFADVRRERVEHVTQRLLK